MDNRRKQKRAMVKYKLFKNVLNASTLDYLRKYTLKVKEMIEPMEGMPKENGSGGYWKGIDMASSIPIASNEDNQKLFELYTSQGMYQLVSPMIPDPYLFNDQIVVKKPGENFKFDEHFDNQYGPYPDDKSLITMNFMLVLDDFNNENGAIEVYDNEWIKLYPSAGDILMIEGNTLHRSGPNNSNAVRRAYLCVYSNRSIGKDFQNGFYYQPFSKYID